MNEIRKNTEEEVNIVDFAFKYETTRFLLNALLALAAAGVTVGGYFIFKDVKDAAGLGVFIMAIFGVLAIISLATIILKTIGCKRSKITVSNRRIYGKYGPYLVKKTFSYRLDEIDNVELKEMFGTKTIIINFQDGKGPRSSYQVRYGNASRAMAGIGVFAIPSVSNSHEVYDKLCDLLLSLKSNVDLEVDMKMARVNVENRKADVMEKIATKIDGTSNSNSSKSDYIDEIKRLKDLLDSGAITKEEFEQEKKEILDSNH